MLNVILFDYYYYIIILLYIKNTKIPNLLKESHIKRLSSLRIKKQDLKKAHG